MSTRKDPDDGQTFQKREVSHVNCSRRVINDGSGSETKTCASMIAFNNVVKRLEVHTHGGYGLIETVVRPVKGQMKSINNPQTIGVSWHVKVTLKRLR